MTIIYSLHDMEHWADEINADLKKDFPVYFAENPMVGSEQWWQQTEFALQNGRITHVGPSVDEHGDLLDVVTIAPLDEHFNGGGYGQPEYEMIRENWWLNPLVQKDKLVQMTSTTLCPSGELDEHSIYIVTQVKVW